MLIYRPHEYSCPEKTVPVYLYICSKLPLRMRQCNNSIQYTYVWTEINHSTTKTWIIFTCLKTLKTLLQELNYRSWNSENIPSFIFSKSSGKSEDGSGQDLNNSTLLTSVIRGVDWCCHHDINLLQDLKSCWYTTLSVVQFFIDLCRCL